MRSMIATGVCSLALFWSLAAPAWSQGTPTSYPTPTSFDAFRFTNAAGEIALARTAAPPSISDDAEILTLAPQGYETAVRGKNGFVCMVDRAWSKPFEDAEFWNPKVRAPECWNAIAARSVLPIFLERTRWVMAGVPKAEIARRTRAALAAKMLPTPEPGTMVYMMSKQGYLSDAGAPHWHPHVMFYFSLKSVPAWGANLPGAPVIQADDDAVGLATVFVLAPKWSDGTSAVMEMK